MAFIADKRNNVESLRQNTWNRNDNTWNRNETSKFSRAGNYTPSQRQNSWHRNPPSVNSTGFKMAGSNCYCTHCKIPGHSYERCFKIHGFPPGFKNGQMNRFVAASVQHDSVEDTTMKQEDQHVAGFTTEQLNSLMQYINKNQGISQQQSTGIHTDSEPQALLAGPYAERASYSTW